MAAVSAPLPRCPAAMAAVVAATAATTAVVMAVAIRTGQQVQVMVQSILVAVVAVAEHQQTQMG